MNYLIMYIKNGVMKILKRERLNIKREKNLELMIIQHMMLP